MSLQATTIKLGNDGQIDIDLPATWKNADVSGGLSRSGVVYTVELRADDNTKILGRLVLLADPIINDMTKDYLLARAQQLGDREAQNSIEKKATIIPLDIENGFGAYYVLTNAKLAGKIPGPNEYKVTASFMIKYGDNLYVTAMLSSDDASNAEFQYMLKAIAGMRPVLNKPSSKEGIKITQTAQGMQISIATSPKKLFILGKSLKPRKHLSGGEMNNPGYFSFQDTQTNILISGWIEPATKFQYSSAKEMWNSDKAGKTKDNILMPKNEEYQQIGDWNVYLYDLQMPPQFKGVSNTHLRANYLDKGTWIDVHLSLTKDIPSKTLRETLIAYLKTLSIVDVETGK